MHLHRKTIILIITLIAVIVGGMFMYAYLKNSEIKNIEEEIVVEDVVPVDPYAYIDRVDAKHFYRDGAHTLIGEIEMPTRCELLDWDIIVAESYPEQVSVNFKIINNSDDCQPYLTKQRFEVSFDVSEEAKISATLNGEPLNLNLIPAEPGENPEDFELYIKG